VNDSLMLVFDLDDTLYPERDFVMSGFQAAGEWLRGQHGIEGFERVCEDLFGVGLRGRIFDEAIRRTSSDLDAGAIVPSLIEVYRGHFPRIRLYDDADWALTHFGQRFRLGLITDGYAATQRRKVAALGIADRFRAIVYSDDLGRHNWKPSPEPYRRLMAQTNGERGRYVYIADNPTKDFTGAREMGWRTVRVRRSGGEYSKLMAINRWDADMEITDLRDLLKTLRTGE
jgi:putative hydrolase of the HAD superfamily